MWPLLLIGLVLLGLLSRSKVTSLTNSQIQDKANRLTAAFQAAGFGPNMVRCLVAQSRVESGNYQSELAQKFNNYFGMKWARWQGVGSVTLFGSSWANPASLEDSARIQISYLLRNKYPKEVDSPEQFVSLLQSKKYFGDESAANYLKAIKSRL